MTRRGQGMVEMALGVFVFVTVLLFGIHFAEVGHVSLKVQEAANAAMWDSTSQQMHDVTAHEWVQWRDAVRFGEAQANLRYVDFDGVRTQATTLNQVLTVARNLRVRCEELAPVHRLLPLAPDPAAALAYPNGMSGIACGAEAELVGYRIPQTFLDGNLSEATHFTPIVIRACAVGRAAGSRCPHQLAMLLDDWGYSGDLEARECGLAWEGGVTCANQGYWDQVAAVYVRVPLEGSGSRLASVVAGASPIDEDQMFLSFRGREGPYGPYTEWVQRSHGDLFWETTAFQNPANDRYDALRYNCWLGGPCR